jgi:hypothetical protein
VEIPPAGFCRLFCYLFPSLGRHPCLPAHPAESRGGRILNVLRGQIFDLAGSYLADHDGSTDYVGWAFFTFWSFGVSYRGRVAELIGWVGTMRMKRALLIFLMAFSTPASADDKDEKNIYDVFRQWLKPTADASIDEQVTASIKRYMANLLYLVDMSSFAGPHKDAKFRDLIMVLQKQMGNATTGILTSDQFDRLVEASRDIDNRVIGLVTAKVVFRSDDGNSVSAIGTGAMDDIANPINITRIFCLRPDGTCEMSVAEFDPKKSMLYFGSPIVYEVKTWMPDRVTAIREHPCGTALMTINVTAEAATIVSTPDTKLAVDLWVDHLSRVR